jgi:hypothetical protein
LFLANGFSLAWIRLSWSPNWLKVKNPKHPAMQLVKEALDAKARKTRIGESGS